MNLPARANLQLWPGHPPRWRRDGSEIFYLAPGNVMTTTEVTEKGGALKIGDTHALFALGPTPGGWYDISADGQRILKPVPVEPVPGEEDTASAPITIVQNWTAGLK